VNKHKHTSNGRTLPPDCALDAIHKSCPSRVSSHTHTALGLPYTKFSFFFTASSAARPVAWPLNHALPINAHSAHQHVLGTLSESEARGASGAKMSLSSNRDSESSSHGSHFTVISWRQWGIDNTSSHLVKQLTKHRLDPFLKSDSFSSLARVLPHSTSTNQCAQTALQGVPAIQPSDDLSSA
jgi:hypothetical protein